MVKKQTKVRVQQSPGGQNRITIPELIASEWLDVKKGDRLEFKPYKGQIIIVKVEKEK